MPERKWDPRQSKPRKPRDKSRFAPKPKPARPGIPEGVVILYGWHTVAAALANPRRKVRKIFATENGAHRLTSEGLVLPVAPEIARPDAIAARLSPDAVHQGLLVEAEPLPALDLEDIEADGTVLVLDQITDPHNVGAILRSAAAFGAIGIVTQDRHSPPESGVIAKAASGALERVPWARVVNLARALEEIGEAGFWRIGLTGDADTDLKDALGPQRVALVLGAEGPGLRLNTKEHCDALARLPISEAIESLNVSNAAAVALYAASTH